jgi:hypothetical protein
MEGTMHRLLLPAAVCAIAVFAAAVVTAGGAEKRTRTLRFDEKTTLFNVIDNPPADTGQDPEAGDTVLFRGTLMRGTKKVGTDQGFCIVITPPVAQCTATFFFAGGSFGGSDSFDFSDKKPQGIAFMGGTGAYAGMQGQGKVTQVSNELARWVVTLRS